MTALKERIEKLEGIIQEEDMQARRGKSIIMVGTKAFARMTEAQFAATLMEKEHEHKRLLKQQEDELHQKIEEEMNTKIRDLEHKVVLQERDYKMALQEKELQIKELELNKARTRQETTAVHHHKRPFSHQTSPPPRRPKLKLSDIFASGASTAGPSSASGLDTKLSEWKPKAFYRLLVLA